MVKPSFRTKSIGTKVTEEEYAKLELTAQAGGKTVGEWCREVMLASANPQLPKGLSLAMRHLPSSSGSLSWPELCCTTDE
jgi:hypothetical protein